MHLSSHTSNDHLSSVTPLPSALPHSVYGVNVGFTFSVYLNLSFLLQCSRGKALTLCLLCCICQAGKESRAFLQSHLTVSTTFQSLFPIILAGQRPLNLFANGLHFYETKSSLPPLQVFKGKYLKYCINTSCQILEALQHKSVCMHWPSTMLKKVNMLRYVFKVKMFSGAVARLATYLSGRSQVETMQTYFAQCLFP